MKKERFNNETSYYTDTDIARLLGISLGRLRNKLTAGDPLPPRIEPPGCRHRLWPCQVVHAWLARYTVTAAVPLAHHPTYRLLDRSTRRRASDRRR